MEIKDLQAALKSLPLDPAVRTPFGRPAEQVFVNLGPLNESTLYLGRWMGKSPWERHPIGEELIHVLSGEVIITLGGPEDLCDVVLREHCCFIVPRGVWHRQTSEQGVTALYATPTPSDFSWTDVHPDRIS